MRVQAVRAREPNSFTQLWVSVALWNGATLLGYRLNAPCDAIHIAMFCIGLTCAEEQLSTGSQGGNATTEESAGRLARTSTAGE